jgi:hypothetical protein
MTEKQIAEADTRTLAKIAAAYERTIERFGGLRRVGEREEYEAVLAELRRRGVER